MFQIGDEVECFKLHHTFLKDRLGQTAKVIGLSHEHPKSIILSEPFNTFSSYRADCFRLVNITLENE